MICFRFHSQKENIRFRSFLRLATSARGYQLKKPCISTMAIKNFKMKLKEEDIPKLDFLLDKMLERSSFVDAEDFISDGLYHPKDRKKAKEDFLYFISIFKIMGVAEPIKDNLIWLLKPNLKTLPFKRDGGFKKLYEDSVRASNEINQKQIAEIRKQVQEEIIRQKSIEKFSRDKIAIVISAIVALVYVIDLLWRLLG